MRQILVQVWSEVRRVGADRVELCVFHVTMVGWTVHPIEGPIVLQLPFCG